ncbi:MAG TPA: transglutaminase-like cysteine peptidase [Stellaceae bacterium]|nr:transglutaminase-like cysteine peptidase [Stellaceae bacterium]
MKYKIAFLSAILTGLVASPSLPAHAGGVIATGAAVVPPSGFIHFCIKHSEECLVSGQAAVRMELTPVRQGELREVQARINAAIEPREDPRHLWEYARDGRGDCNTFALTKRRALIALGWPEETLLLAAVYTEHNEGHLVLVARTSQGDLVLDNRLPRIVEWTVLPYRWVSMQSQTSPARWVRVTSESVATADSGQNAAVTLR